MSKSIYNISTELQKIFNDIENDGEVSAENETALSISIQELENKGIQYGYKCLELDAELIKIDAELERIKKYKDSCIKLKERLKNTLSGAMLNFGVHELKTPTLKINFRKSENIEIADESLINEKYKIPKTTYTISKTAIKEAIKKGEIVIGAELLVKENLQIK